MARTDSFADQYWQGFPRGALARSELQKDHLVEFATFTGSDIKAFILPDGDEAARNELVRRLNDIPLLTELVDDADTPFSAGNLPDVERYTEFDEVVGNISQTKDILPLIGLQSITISTFRAKSQVRALGHVNARGLARGSRTVAGTFIITEFDRDAFWGILSPPIKDTNVGDSGYFLPDQMRPFDILLMAAHELGNIAVKYIKGIEIVTNGIVYSIQDYYSENTLSYIAHDASPLIPLGPDIIGDIFTDQTGGRIRIRNLVSVIRGKTLSDQYLHLKRARSPFD